MTLPDMLKKARYKFSKPYEKRVFIGGNYDFLPVLRQICNFVEKTGFQPVLAFDYDVPADIVYEFDLGLMGECKHAIFEVSAGNGHLLELQQAIDMKKNVFCLYGVRGRRGKKPPPSVSSMLTTANIVLLGYDSFENLREIIHVLFPGIEEDLPASLRQVLKIARVPRSHAQTILSYVDSSNQRKKKIEKGIADIRRDAEDIRIAAIRKQIIEETERLKTRIEELEKKRNIPQLSKISETSKVLEEQIDDLQMLMGAGKEFSDWKKFSDDLERIKETHIPREVVEANLQRLDEKIDKALELLAEKAKIRERKNKDVFIVHGRSHEPMKELKMMLYEFGLNPIVLHEQPSEGKTLVEKLEKYSNVSYAFAILTPDDGGVLYNSFREASLRLSDILKEMVEDARAIGEAASKFTKIMQMINKRARQNVVLEFGYFVGKLGRNRVCCLHQGDIELPSDMYGIVYIPFKTSVEEVRYKIIKELMAAGFEIEI